MSNREREHFHEFGEHTLLKHMILDKYLKAWARKLLLWGRAGDQVWFVDAFAGEGYDRAMNPGSPVIAADIAKGVLVDLGPTDAGEAPMRVLAVERRSVAFERLKESLAPFTDEKPQIAAARKGTLHARLSKFMEYIGERPVLFFLDPCGVDGLVVEDLPELLSGPHNEVFALFSDVGAYRLHAALLTPDRDRDYEIRSVRDAPSLFRDLDNEKVEVIEAEVEVSNEALRRTRKGAERILTQALKAEALPELAALPEGERLPALTKIFTRRLMEAGAKHVLSFPVRNERSTRVYQLVHASKSRQGLRAMKEAMHAALNRSSLPEAARKAISFDVSVEIGPVLNDIREHFHGSTARWSQGNNREVDTVKRYLLEETPVFPNQLEEIRSALKETGTVVSRKPLVFSFEEI
jgi:three-Cys-motif partner protein